MIKVYVFKVAEEPVHSFTASNDHAAAVVVRSMIDRTLYGYRTEAVICAYTPGAGEPRRPSILDAIKDGNFRLECNSLDNDGWFPVYDPLLELADFADETIAFVERLKEEAKKEWQNS